MFFTLAHTHIHSYAKNKWFNVRYRIEAETGLPCSGQAKLKGIIQFNRCVCHKSFFFFSSYFFLLCFLPFNHRPCWLFHFIWWFFIRKHQVLIPLNTHTKDGGSHAKLNITICTVVLFLVGFFISISDCMMCSSAASHY